MKSLIPIVAVTFCLLVWRAEGQGQTEGGGSGLYSTPAYSGDSGGLYVSPAFSGGSTEAAPGMGGAPGYSRGTGRGERGRYGYSPSYGVGNLGAYTTPAFSGPSLGILVTPHPVPKAKPKSSTGPSGANPPGGTAPVKPSGTSAAPPGGGGSATNLLEKPTLPPSTSTNAPAGQGATGPL